MEPNIQNTQTRQEGIQASPPVQTPPELHKKTSGGPIIAAIIIIVLLILSGLYFWGAKLNESSTNNTLPLIPTEESTNPPVTQSDQDTVSNISADIAKNKDELDSMNADIDAALQQMDEQLQANL